jgi:RND family efflux transporter MFP subunit
VNTETRLDNGLNQESHHGRPAKKSHATGWFLLVLLIVLGVAGGYFFAHKGSAANPTPPPPAKVSVSKPLKKDLDTRLGLLGQFSAVDQVELRAQVGGTLTGIYFKDGEIVQKGQVLFTIDSRPYEIKLSQATAQLETAKARLQLADRELRRAQDLVKSSAGTVQSVEQRTAEQLSAAASADDAKAQIRDAQLDMEHCRIVAPFSGRIGTHLVSVGNLIAGSRAATSPTTLLAALVSLDPIHLDFDLSESDFQTFTQYRKQLRELPSNKVEFALGGDQQFARSGTLDFINNVLDRASGTIHARATVPNPDLFLIPGEFARVRLAVAHAAPTLLIPDAAVLPDQSQYTVMTVGADNTVVPKLVKPGDKRGGLRVIQSGLDENDRVIVGGLPYASPGAKVDPQDSDLQFAANQD